MKIMICEICGGHEIIKEDGVFICQDCGAKYSVEEAKKLLSDTETSDSKCPLCGKSAPLMTVSFKYDKDNAEKSLCCADCFEDTSLVAQCKVLESNLDQYPVGFTKGRYMKTPKSEEEETDSSESDFGDDPPEASDLLAPPIKPSPSNSPPKKSIGPTIFLLILLGCILFGLGSCMYFCAKDKSSSSSKYYSSSSYSYSGSGSSSSSSSNDSVYIPADLSDSLMSKIWDAAKEDVKKNLKSPSTAKFEKYYSDDVKFIKATEEDVKTGGFNLSVFSYVDSQNSFGAEIRTYFIVYFMIDRYNDFKIVDSLFYDG